MTHKGLNSDDFLRLSEQVWPIQKNHLFMARKNGCPSVADLTHFGALVEREVLRRASESQAPAPAPLSSTVAAALRRAFSLGQTYWQQAESESYSQNAKSDITRGEFDALLEDTTAAVAATQCAAVVADDFEQERWRDKIMELVDALADESATKAYHGEFHCRRKPKELRALILAELSKPPVQGSQS